MRFASEFAFTAQGKPCLLLNEYERSKNLHQGTAFVFSHLGRGMPSPAGAFADPPIIKGQREFFG